MKNMRAPGAASAAFILVYAAGIFLGQPLFTFVPGDASFHWGVYAPAGLPVIKWYGYVASAMLASMIVGVIVREPRIAPRWARLVGATPYVALVALTIHELKWFR